MQKILPKKIDIMGVPFKVQVEKDPTVPSPDGEGEMQVMGYCHGAGQTIAVSSELPDEMMLSTFLHEVIEAFVFRLELDLPHPHITMLEAAFHQLLMANKKSFIKILQNM